jgi:hypothetical protein
MLAAYHRVVKPAVFAAAVASSAPLTYVFGTQMWADTSNKYHQVLEDSLNANSGSSKCAGIVREGLDDIMRLSETRAGRRQLSTLFSLCPGTAANVVKTQSAGFAFFMVSGKGYCIVKYNIRIVHKHLQAHCAAMCGAPALTCWGAADFPSVAYGCNEHCVLHNYTWCTQQSATISRLHGDTKRYGGCYVCCRMCTVSSMGGCR